MRLESKLRLRGQSWTVDAGRTRTTHHPPYARPLRRRPSTRSESDHVLDAFCPRHAQRKEYCRRGLQQCCHLDCRGNPYCARNEPHGRGTEQRAGVLQRAAAKLGLGLRLAGRSRRRRGQGSDVCGKVKTRRRAAPWKRGWERERAWRGVEGMVGVGRWGGLQVSR